MKRLGVLVAAGALLLARAGTAAAQTYDVETLVRKARTDNPELVAARFDRSAAEADVRAASALENPTLRLEWLHMQEERVSRMGFGAGFAWTPPQPGVWGAGKDEARARVEAVKADLRDKAAAVESDVRKLCAALSSVGEAEELAAHAVETRKSLVAALARRVDQGASTRIDLVAARLSLTRAERDRDLLALDHARGAQELALLVGLPASASVEPRGAAPADEVGAPLPSAPSPLLFAGDRARTEAARASLAKERARRYPWLQLASLPRFRVNEQSSYPVDFAVAIDVSLPIFDQNAGRIDKARASIDKQEAEHRAHVAAASGATAIARVEVERRAAALAYLETAVAPLVKEHGALVEAALKNGELDIPALLVADDAALRAQRDVVDARLALRLARLALLRSLGAFLRSP